VDFRYRVFPPSPALAPFVDCIWMVDGFASFDREVVLPNGVIELMVNFGPMQKVIGYAEVAVDEDFHDAWLAGIQDQPLTIASPHGSNLMGVRFRPGGAHAFFHLPMDEFTNRVIPLDLIIGGDSSILHERLLAVEDDDRARVRVAEAWLLERRSSVHPYYTTVRRSIELFRESSFTMGVGELCDRLGLSNRHLIEQFRRVVGLTPKTTSRVARFHSVIESLREPHEPDWARLAYRFGFADQAHLVREFRRFAGVTPTTYLARRTPDEDHLLLE
jgi:AraC-like DNA-binding protein